MTNYNFSYAAERGEDVYSVAAVQRAIAKGIFLNDGDCNFHIGKITEPCKRCSGDHYGRVGYETPSKPTRKRERK